MGSQGVGFEELANGCEEAGGVDGGEFDGELCGHDGRRGSVLEAHD